MVPAPDTFAPSGRCYEDFAIGDSFDTASRTVTNEDIAGFAGLTGDRTPLHVDEEWARNGPFERRIAHGALIFSLSLGLATETGLLQGIVALSRVDALRFVRPVYIGDTLRVTKRVTATGPHTPRGGIVAFDTRVLNQHGQIVAAYVDRVLVTRRPPRT